MNRSRRLAAVSAAQLVFGIAGLRVAVRRGHAFDIPGWKGSPDRVASEAWWIGTALSPPVPMLAAQAVSTVAVARGGSRGAARVLGLLGAGMTAGCAIERLVGRRLTPAGWDRVESPVALGCGALALAMVGAAVTADRDAAGGAR